MAFRGAIFDWDGVMVNSAGHHKEGWERLARELGRPLPADHFLRGFGKKNEWIIAEMLEWTREAGEVARLSLRKEALFREVVRERGLALLPGARDFLVRLRERGIPCAVGSSTHRENIQAVLEPSGLAGFFAAMITAENVSRGKPDPEVFLAAAAALGLPPAGCAVFEDMAVGVEAARAGGFRAVAFTHTVARGELGRAHLVVDGFEELTTGVLDALFANVAG